MRKAKTKEEIQTSEWRKRCFNQEVFFFETVDAEMTRDEDGTERIQLGNTHFLPLEEWDSKGDTYCVDFGQNWFHHGVIEQIKKVRQEIADYKG